MSTDVAFVLVTDDGAASSLKLELIRTIEDFERRFSRFLPHNELSELNARAGRATRVSRDMLELLLACERAFEFSEGVFDPTIADVLDAIGYDRSFDLLPETADASTSGRQSLQNRLPFTSVAIDPMTRTVALPDHVRVDFGGIGKGFLLDKLSECIETVTKSYWISIGGDLIASGTDETGRSWTVGVQHPSHHDDDIAELELPGGRTAVATSGTTKRRGIRHGHAWHHLIDPRSNAPAQSDCLGMTVIARSGVCADILAKTGFILGTSAGLAFIEKRGAEGLAVDKNLNISMTRRMSASVV